MTNNVIILNSIDRDWDNSSAFSYKFTFNSGGISGNLYQSLKNIKEFYIESIVVPNIFIDICSVHASKKLGLLPSINADINLPTLSFPRITDLKYLVVNIDELTGNISGSHSINNKATAMFMYDTTIPKMSHSNLTASSYLDSSRVKMYKDSHFQNRGEEIIYNTNHDYVVLKNVSTEPTFYVKDILGSVGIHFFRPDGEKLSLLNDILTIESIGSTKIKATSMTSPTVSGFTTSTVLKEGLYIDISSDKLVDNNTYILTKSSTAYTLNRSLSSSIEDNTFFESRKIEIICKTYFSSEEYKIGDTLILRNLDSINVGKDLTTFLERPLGHTIVSLRRQEENTTLYNIIEILPQIVIDKSSGLETIHFFGLETDVDDSFKTMSGNIMNRDNQNFISINIKN